MQKKSLGEAFGITGFPHEVPCFKLNVFVDYGQCRRWLWLKAGHEGTWIEDMFIIILDICIAYLKAHPDGYACLAT